MLTKLFAAVLFVAASTSMTFAQDVTTQSIEGQRAISYAQQSGITSESTFFQDSPEQNLARELRNRVRNATEQLRNAESSEDREQAQEELRGALSADYDARMTAYASYLDKLEERLDEMKKKLNRRRDAKKDMVELRIQVLEAEADDLGWPEGSARLLQHYPGWPSTDSPFSSNRVLTTRPARLTTESGR